MALFSVRDRIAIACLSGAILLGWGVRYVLYRHQTPDEVRVIRHAVELPTALTSPDSAAAELSRAAVVDINRADVTVIETLPGIGPVKAAAIAVYREKHGAFSSPEEIMKVRGIGPATYEAIRTFITVGEDSAQGHRKF